VNDDPARGLGLGESAKLAQGPVVGHTSTLRVDQLRAGSQQPRRQFGTEGLTELAASIQSQGILQPLLVRAVGDTYEIVAGERRWRAAQLAGLTEVPVIVKSLTDQEAAVIALIENLQRENLNLIDEVEGKLLLVANALGIASEQARSRLNELLRNPVPEDVETLSAVFLPLGRESWQSFAKNKVRILNYPPPLVEALRQGMALTMATLIARAPENKQADLIAKVQQGAGRKEIVAEVERLCHRPTVRLEKRVAQALGNQKWLDRLDPQDAEAMQHWLSQMPRALQQEIGDN